MSARSSSPVPADDLRASDAERERVVETLRDHAGQGRLSVDELSQRVDGAYAARTHRDLSSLVADLPAPPAPRRSVERKRRGLHSHAVSFVLVNLLLIAIWAATGFGYFWPMWPLLGWGFGLARHASAVRGFGHRHGASSA